jgi:hypothetical protein
MHRGDRSQAARLVVAVLIISVVVLVAAGVRGVV